MQDLTNSFGWKESDAFTQHDVQVQKKRKNSLFLSHSTPIFTLFLTQELCRVLFDALEKVLKGTEQENLINDLYQGEMQDYVKCKVTISFFNFPLSLFSYLHF